MRRILLTSLFASAALAQVSNFGGLGGFSGPTGLNHSTYTCVDRDGDGYGTGPLAVINTTISASTAAGIQTVTPASMTTSVANVTTTNGSPTLTGITNLYTLQAGETISGTGIPANTTILYVSTGLIPPTVTMSANATASGTVTVSIGIGVGSVLRMDLSTNMERIVVTAIAPTTFTATFLISHVGGVTLSDQGCFGPDADDLDSTVVTAADVANKYESGSANTAVPHFLNKLANDILLANPGGTTADTAAMVSTLRSPTIVYWLAPSTASPAGSNSNSCITAAAPCQTIAALLTSGARGGTNYTSGSTGVLVFFRQGWDEGQITVFSGTSSKYTIYMSYPGEQATPSATHFINIPDTSYIRLDGFKLTGGAYIGAGTTNTGIPQASISWHDNLYTHIDATGPFSTLGGLNGFGQTNNVFEDSTYHDNSATGSQHGIYIGSRNLQSTNILLQRLLLYRNTWNGLHFNGMCSGCTVQNSIAYGNGITGFDLEMGWNHSTLQSNLSFDNAKQITLYDYESGQCPGRTLLQAFTGTTTNGSNSITGISSAITSKFQTTDIVSGPGIPTSSAITSISATSITISNNATASATVTLQDGLQYKSGTVVICPNDENFNLFQNNTIYASGADSYPSFNTPQAGCSATFANCAQNAIPVRNVTEIDPTNPGGSQTQAGNFNNNIWRNNIIISNGKNNTAAPIDFSQNDGVNGEMCDSTCQNWMSTGALDHDVFWQSDGNNGTNALSRASGATKYTCGTAGSVITLTSCIDGNPTFADVVQASYYNNKSRYDFRLLTGSNAFHTGTITAIPGYDLAGRAFVETTPSIGGIERNLYVQGWTTLTGAGINSLSIDPTTGLSVVPANGAPLSTTSGSCASSATSCNFTDVTNMFVGVLIGIESELTCPSAVTVGVSPAGTVTFGSVASCSGTTSGNGRGWAGTTAVTHSSGVTAYLNTLQTSGAQGTSPATYYQFQTQYPQGYTAGVGSAGVARDIAGQNKELCVAGGGHSNYVGNEIYCVFPNRTAPFISRAAGPSTYALASLDNVGTYGTSTATASAAAQLQDGAWNVAHIQSNFAYMPWSDKFFKFGGGYAGGNGPHGYDTMIFNFSTSLWERFSGATNDVDCTNHGTGFTSCVATVGHQLDPIGDFNPATGGFSGQAIADPVTQTVWEWVRATGGSSAVLTQYYPSVHQHVTRALSLFDPICCGTVNQGSNSVFDSSRRHIITVTWNTPTLTVHQIDISGVSSQTPSSSPNPSPTVVTPDATCTTPLSTAGPGMAYIPQIDRIVLYPSNTGGNTYYLMTPDTFVCTSYTFTGGPATSPFNPYIGGMMQPFPSLDAVVLINDTGTNTRDGNPRVLSFAAPDPTGSNPPPVTPGGIFSGIIGSGVFSH